MRIRFAAMVALLGVSGGSLWFAVPVQAGQVHWPRLSAAAPAGAAPSSERTGSPGAGGYSNDIPEWQARWELARLLSHTRRYAEALAEYAKLLKEKPNLWQAKAEMAAVLFWNNQPDRALALFQEIPQGQMDDAARMVLADLYVAQEKYSKAEPLLRAHLRRFPRDQRVRLKLADLLSYEKRYQESLKQYELILKEHPDDIQVRRRYAVVLSWAGQRERAIKELQKTLQ